MVRGVIAMSGEDYEEVVRVAEQTYQVLVREYLTVLGLVSRLEDAYIADDEWLRLLKLTFPVIECASHMRPAVVGESVRIDSIRGAPDRAGWITMSTTVQPAYWIPKADLPKLRRLEVALDGLAPRRRH